VKKTFYLITFFIIIVNSLWAQGEFNNVLSNDQKITSIVVNGNETASREYILRTVGITTGDFLTVPKIEMAVKKLYKLGIFDDVRIAIEEYGDGIKLIIDLIESKKLGEIQFEGNKKIKEKELLELSGLSIGQILNNNDLFKAEKGIEAKYIEKGYNRATVRSVHMGDSSDSSDVSDIAKIKFVIDEGNISRVKKINFYGNNEFSDKKLRGVFDEIHQKRFILRSGHFDKNLLVSDIELVKGFYKNNGFPAIQVVSDSFYYNPENPEEIIIDITLNEGNKIYFNETQIIGNTVIESETLYDKLTHKKGEPYSDLEIEKSQFFVVEPYQEMGYIFANAQPKKRIVGDSLNLVYEIYEGSLAYVRKINITGNDRTFDKVIRREFALKPGDVFQRSKLMRSQRNVYYLNFFEDAVPDFDVLDDGQVDLTMKVTEKNIGRFQIGAAFNSQDKLVGTIDVGWPNVLGRGYEAEFQWEFGKTKNNVSLSFTNPWFMDKPTTVGFDVYNTITKWEDYYTQSKLGAAVRLGRRLKIPDDFSSVYWRYSLQKVDYYDFESKYDPTPTYDLRTRGYPLVESSMLISFVRDTRDSRMFATSGSRNAYSIEGAGHFLGGDIDYQIQDIRSDWYLPVSNFLTFVAKARFSFVTNWGGELADVPYSERLFPGGVSTDGQIRGYDDRSISPTDTIMEYDSTLTPDPSGTIPLTGKTSFLAGGTALSIYTLEMRVPIMRDQLYASLFFDAGNTWLNFDDMSLNDLYKSTGVGVRFVIPMIGVLGFDMAYGYDRPDKPDWKFHFQIGAEQ